MTSKVEYLGQLRTKSEHIRSGESIITDAPTDNNGKGEAFSPTDMVANSLATCMITIMGIRAAKKDLSIEGSTAEVIKTMASDPRRISKIEVYFEMKGNVSDEVDRKVLEKAAMTCPVIFSLHPDVEKEVSFNWGEI